MAITLSENQQQLVATRRKGASNRPEYYSAGDGKFQTISEDFEAFLILQKTSANDTTVNWLKQCSTLASRDLDRNSLAATALKNEIIEAQNAQKELAPLIRLFADFKQNYSLTGFEDVVECGLLLDDVQAAMDEVISLSSRLVHRETYGILALSDLRGGEGTLEQNKELNSWFSPLTSY